jgi:hypothetical protein
MASLTISDEQVVELALQLPEPQRRELVKKLIRWPAWEKQFSYAAERFRQTALERGKNWDAMSEEDKEDFINDIVHEDRPCNR